MHSESHGPRVSRKKACIACFRAKIKCLAEVPCCSSCQRRKIECRYNSIPRSALPRVKSKHRAAQEFTAVSAGSDIVANSLALTPAYESVFPAAPSREGILDGGFLDRTSGEEWRDLDNRNGSWTNGSTMSMDQKGFDSMLQDTLLDTDLDWSNNFYSDLIFPSLLDSPQSPPISDATFERVARSAASETISEVLYPDLSSLPTPSEEQYVGPGDRWAWLMEKPGAHVHRLILPAIGCQDDGLNSRFYPTLSISEALRSRLQDCIRVPLDRGPWQTVSLQNFPSCNHLEHCMDAYFMHSHPVFYLLNIICR